MKVRVAWDTTIVESYVSDIEYEDFAEAIRSRGGEPPTPEQLDSQSVFVDGWSDAGADFEDTDPEYVSVTEREITEITVL